MIRNLSIPLEPVPAVVNSFQNFIFKDDSQLGLTNADIADSCE